MKRSGIRDTEPLIQNRAPGFRKAASRLLSDNLSVYGRALGILQRPITKVQSMTLAGGGNRTTDFWTR